jgi:hypothetical protein
MLVDWRFDLTASFGNSFLSISRNQLVPDRAGPPVPCLGSNHCCPTSVREGDISVTSVTVVPDAVHDIGQRGDIDLKSHGVILALADNPAAELPA